MSKAKNQKQPIEKHRLIYVEWVDSYGCGHEWESTREISAYPHCCHSVGWAVKETEDVIVVIPHLSPENEKINAGEQGCGDMTIPIVSIKRMVTLSV